MHIIQLSKVSKTTRGINTVLQHVCNTFLCWQNKRSDTTNVISIPSDIKYNINLLLASPYNSKLNDTANPHEIHFTYQILKLQTIYIYAKVEHLFK